MHSRMGSDVAVALIPRAVGACWLTSQVFDVVVGAGNETSGPLHGIRDKSGCTFDCSGRRGNDALAIICADIYRFCLSNGSP